MTCPRCHGRGRAADVIRYTWLHFAACKLCQGLGYRELGGEG